MRRGEENECSSLMSGPTQRSTVESRQSTSAPPRVGLNLSGGIVRESPQSIATSAGSPESEISSVPRETHRSEARLCGVCGDVAKSHHFGGLSCHSCKAFFRRSVQNDLYTQFVCTRGRLNCHMTKTSRKTCQYCRMRRCFEIGMNKRWVLTDEERRALAKTRSEKKSSNVPASEAVATSGSYVPQLERMTDFLSAEEVEEIETIVEKFAEAYRQIPYRSELHSGDVNRPGFQVMEFLGSVVKRFALYARMMPDFVSLPSQDQRILLKGGVLEMYLLRGAYSFDPVRNRWPNTDMPFYKDAPVVSLDDVTRIVSPAVIEKHIGFIRSVQKLDVDEAIVMLLTLIVLFTSRPGISCPGAIEDRQIHYTTLLGRYAEWRFGPGRSKKLFNKLLTKLCDLRELSESHNQQNLHFENDELATIQQQLKDLKISPFPEFNVLGADNGSNSDRDAQQEESSAYSAHQAAPTPPPSSVETASALQLSIAPLNLAQQAGEMLKRLFRSTDCSSSPVCEEFKNRMKQSPNLQSVLAMHFMEAIHHSVDEMLSQSESFCFPRSPPSLNVEDYEPSFELSGLPFQGDTSSTSGSTESPVAAEGVGAEEQPQSEKLLEDICCELSKYFERK